MKWRRANWSSEQRTQACLERIASRNPVVKAWVYVNADKALERARLVDREGRRQRLDGVPLGLKDIIDTADMPTELAIRRSSPAAVLPKTRRSRA